MNYLYLLICTQHEKHEVIGIKEETDVHVQGTILYSEVVPGDVGLGWANTKANIAEHWGMKYDMTQEPLEKVLKSFVANIDPLSAP